MEVINGYRITSKEKPLFDKIVFVAGAISKDRNREPLTGMRIEQDGFKEQQMVATDGRKLHCAAIPNATLKTGLYKVKREGRHSLLLTEMNEALVFPNWKHVVPENCTLKISSPRYGEADVVGKVQHALGKAGLARATDEVLAGLVTIPEEFVDVLAIPDDKFSVLKIVGEDCFIVAMPLRETDC